MIRDKMGVDLRTDLHGITLYGRDTEKTHGVAIVFAKVNEKLLLEKAAKATDHKVTKHGKIDIHSWTQKCGPKTHPAAGAFYKPDVLVFAASVEGVAAAIDVLDGKSAGITDPKSPLGGHVYAGATVLARAIAIPPQARCPILKQAESFRVALGEHEGKSFYRASVVMKSPEAAAQVKAIAEGVKAMASLRFSGECRRHEARQRPEGDGQGQHRSRPLGCLGRRCLDRGGQAGQEGRRAYQEGRHVPVLPKTAWASVRSLRAKAGKCPAGCQCPACKAKPRRRARPRQVSRRLPVPRLQGKAKAKAEGPKPRPRGQVHSSSMEWTRRMASVPRSNAPIRPRRADCRVPLAGSESKADGVPPGLPGPACKAKAKAKADAEGKGSKTDK